MTPAPVLLGDVLRRYGDGTPGTITYLEPGSPEVRLSYGELLDQARRNLAVLQEAGLRPGDYAILSLTSSQDVLPAFWACVLGGIVPTVLSLPRSLSRDSEALRKLQHVWRVLEQPLVVLGEEHRSALEACDEAEHPLPGARCLTYTGLADGRGGAAREHRGSPGDLAMLQFSSGSTGTPKGVRLTHDNLLSNLADMIPHWHAGPEDTFVSWMPESHDMGLICMHIHPLYAGASQVQLSPLTFARRPVTLLEAIDRFRGTVTAAPNFGLALLLDKALTPELPDVDLSSLRIVGNAAEPISVEVMRRFTEVCAPLGLRPESMTCCYGLAEGTVGVTSAFPEDPFAAARLDRDAFYQHKVVPAGDGDRTAVEVACLGRPVASVRIRITDDEDSPLPDDVIGHVQITGPTVTSGYQADPVATAETFCGAWLRTGDLGFLRDGELYLTGRVKDVIFVQGNNLYAADVEARVHEVSPLRPGEVAACGYTDWDTGQERLALFVKTDRAGLTDDDLLDLRQRLVEALGVRVDTVLPVPGIPRTTSGKLQRHKLGEALQAGQLREQVEHWQRLCRSRAAERRPVSLQAALRGTAAPDARTES